MTDSSSERPELLDVLRSGPIGVSTPDDVENAREQMLPWLEDQVTSLPARRADSQRRASFRVLAWSGGGILAAAAAVAFALVRPAAPKGQAPVASAARSDIAPAATVLSGRLSTDEGIVTAGGRLAILSRMETTEEHTAAFRAHGGYQVELAEGSSLLVHDNANQNDDVTLRLERGSASFSVLPRPKGSVFRVVTDDATTTVVGTSFSVEVRQNSATCVRVTEGRVKVDRARKSRTLSPDQSWGCEPTTPAKTIPKPAPAQRSTASTLAAENALLSGALAAERRGDRTQAEHEFRTLLSRYPSSAFAEDARAGLQRVNAQKQKR